MVKSVFSLIKVFDTILSYSKDTFIIYENNNNGIFVNLKYIHNPNHVKHLFPSLNSFKHMKYGPRYIYIFALYKYLYV